MSGLNIATVAIVVAFICLHAWIHLHPYRTYRDVLSEAIARAQDRAEADEFDAIVKAVTDDQGRAL